MIRFGPAAAPIGRRGAHRGRPSLLEDERGAIMVLGLFVAALLIGFLYYVLGVGQTLYHTEKLQDAADSGAYAIAVMHARAMNLLALINMVELSVVALVSALIAVIAAAVATIAWICSSRWRLILYGWTIPFLVIVIVDAADAYDSASDSVDAIHDASERAQRVLIEDLPEIASIRANQFVTEHYGPLAKGAGGFPLRDLPVEDGSVFDMCLRAYPYAFGSAYLAFDDVPLSTIRNRARGYAAAFIPAACLLQGIEPKRVPDDAKLGEEPFQTRAFAVGAPLPTLGESGVKTATWRYDEGGGYIGHLRDVLSRGKLAQAEFYFDGPEGHSEMLWHMGWRARMRRLRSPSDYGEFAVECSISSLDPAVCAELAVYFELMGDAFVH